MIKAMILAVQFLTRLPVNIGVDWNRENLRKSTFYFPFVGLLIGLIAYGVNYLFSYINQDVAAVFTVLALIVVTGGLHLDGLSDTCDGFFSNKDRETILDIMQDSRVGAFGVIGLIIVLLLKYVLIKNLGDGSFIFLVFSLGNSRAVQVFNLAFKKPARESGIGYMFRTSKPDQMALMGIVLYIILISYVDYRILIPLAVNFLFMELLSHYSMKKIGGLTGDVLGTMAELGEVVSLITFLGVSQWI